MIADRKVGQGMDIQLLAVCAVIVSAVYLCLLSWITKRLYRILEAKARMTLEQHIGAVLEHEQA